MSTALGVIGTGYPRPARPALLVGESPLPVGTAARLGETARRLAPRAEVELARDPGILGGATRSRTRGDARSVMVSGRADVTTVRLCASPGSRTSAGDRPGHGRRARSRPPRGTGALAGPATATSCAPGAVAPPPPRSITRGVERASGTTIGTGFRWVGSPRPRGLEHRERRFPPDRPTAGPGATATTPPGPSVGAALLMAAGRLTC